MFYTTKVLKFCCKIFRKTKIWKWMIENVNKCFVIFCGIVLELEMHIYITLFYPVLSPLVVQVWNQSHSDLPRFWFRYVDDVYAVCYARKLNSFLNVLNSQHDTIKFTMEKEFDDVISFLDLSLRKLNDGRLKTNVYWKATSTTWFITADSARHT